MNIIRMATGPEGWDWNLFNALGQVASWIAFLGLLAGAVVTFFVFTVDQFDQAKTDYTYMKAAAPAPESGYVRIHRSNMLADLVAGIASLGLSMIAVGVAFWAVTPIEISILINATASVGYYIGIVLTILGGLLAFVSLVMFVIGYFFERSIRPSRR